MVAVFTPALDDREPQGEARDQFKRAILPLRLELFRMALKMTNSRFDAEDLLQDSFIKALGAIPSLADERNARAWMYSILRSTFFSGIRSQGGVKIDLVPANAMGRVIDRVRHCNGTMTKVSVRRALSRLENPFREPVILCDLFGFSYAEAAERMGCPIGTLMSRLHRGRGKLRDMLCT